MTGDRSRSSSCKRDMPPRRKTPKPGVTTGLIWDKQSVPLEPQEVTVTRKEERARGLQRCDAGPEQGENEQRNGDPSCTKAECS